MAANDHVDEKSVSPLPESRSKTFGSSLASFSLRTLSLDRHLSKTLYHTSRSGIVILIEHSSGESVT